MGYIGNPVAALFKHIAITLLFSLVGLFIGSLLPPSLLVLMRNMFLILILVSFFIAIFSKRSRNRGMSMGFVYFYGLFLGITLYPTIVFYLYDLGGTIVTLIFLGTLLVVSALGSYSYTKGNDNILKLGPFLFIGTLVIFIVSLLFLFFSGLSSFELLITIGSIILFSGWVIYDVYRFKLSAPYIQTTKDLAPFVLDIYIDIINLFLDILRIVSYFKSDD